MNDTRLTPETSATCDFYHSALWTAEDFQQALRTISELRRERDEARAALLGRTVSCSQCNETAKRIEAMREAIDIACEAFFTFNDVGMCKAWIDAKDNALAKLRPFLP